MLKEKINYQKEIERIGDYDIFRYYFGDFSFNKSYKSVFRKDSMPSTGFYEGKTGKIYYNDLATKEKYDAVDFVRKLFGLSYVDAVIKIMKDFDKGGEHKPLVSEFNVHYKRPQPNDKKIFVTTDKWKQYHLDYWKQFHVTQKELDENYVYPVVAMSVETYTKQKELIKRSVLDTPEGFLRFAYLVNYKKRKTIKVYSPYDKEWKWSSSTPNDAPFGWDELPFLSNTLIITKGQKDRIIWKKFCTDVIAVQSESPSALKEEDILFLSTKYKNIYVNFDCDKPGKEASMYFNKYNWKWINVPNIYYDSEGIKDFADLVRVKGLTLMKKYLKWKGVI
jgi:hypothetical protein